MAVLLDQFEQVVGSVQAWLRMDENVTLPVQWLILDGSVIVDPESAWNGLTLPDMRGKFLKGHSTLTNATFGADTDYRINGGGTIPSGGQATMSLAHVHGLASHTHGISGHTHPISSSGTHVHGISNHTHSGASHTHTFTTAAGGTHIHHVNPNVFATQNGRFQQANPGFDVYGTDGSHSHTGTTNAGAGTTGSGGPGTSNSGGDHNHGAVTGAGVGTTDAAAGNTDSALASEDNLPPFLGMLLIVKVK